MKRIKYSHNTGIFLEYGDALVIKKGRSGERIIKAKKWWINRNTPVGDDAELWEVKPYDGKKYIPWSDVISILREKDEKK